MSRPRLFGRLAAPARVIVVSAPPGSGKTVLLRSWIGQAGVAERAAWVPAGRGERDPQQFWLSVTGALAWQGQPEEAEPWVQRAERTVTAEAEPAAAVAVCYIRGVLELGRGRDREALAAFRSAERAGGRLDAPHVVVPRARALRIVVLVRLGEIDPAEQFLAGLNDQDREHDEIRIAEAALRLAQDDPRAAAAALAPVLDGSASVIPWIWLPNAFLLEASARDALGDPDAAGRAVERALDLAEGDRALLWFLLHPVPRLLERQARHRTAHAALIADILGLLAPSPHRGQAARAG